MAYDLANSPYLAQVLGQPVDIYMPEAAIGGYSAPDLGLGGGGGGAASDGYGELGGGVGSLIGAVLGKYLKRKPEAAAPAGGAPNPAAVSHPWPM